MVGPTQTDDFSCLSFIKFFYHGHHFLTVQSSCAISLLLKMFEIDPDVASTQNEWEEELSSAASSASKRLKLPIRLGDISNPFDLASVWLIDAFHARRPDFPQSNFELELHKIARSTWFRYLFDASVACQVLATMFFAANECNTTLSGASSAAFITIDVFCVGVYATDLGLNLGVNRQEKQLLRKPWSLFRLICCGVLIVDIFSYTSAHYNRFRVIRSIFPFFFVARHTNTKRMMQLTWAAAIKSLPVIIALISILFIWGYAGFLLFRRVDVIATHFASPWEVGSLYECAHAVAMEFVLFCGESCF